MKFQLVLLGSFLVLHSSAAASDFTECLALREFSGEIISKARREESRLSDQICLEVNFRKKLNSESEWAFVTDTSARKLCRNKWKTNTPYAYKDLFGNGYRSDAATLLAKDLDVIGVKLSSLGCPTADLKWNKEALSNSEYDKTKLTWAEKLSSNPALSRWAEMHPKLAEIEKVKWESK